MRGAFVQIHALADVGQAQRSLALTEQIEHRHGTVQALQLIGIGRLGFGRLFFAPLKLRFCCFLPHCQPRSYRASHPPSTTSPVPVT